MGRRSEALFAVECETTPARLPAKGLIEALREGWLMSVATPFGRHGDESSSTGSAWTPKETQDGQGTGGR